MVKKDQSQKDVEKIINIISELRSFKNELNVSPGSFVDISINKIAKKNKTLMSNNEVVLKRLGRINNFYEKDQAKPSATLVISGDIFKIYFDENVDLNLIKEFIIKNNQEISNGALIRLFCCKDFIFLTLIFFNKTFYNSSSCSPNIIWTIGHCKITPTLFILREFMILHIFIVKKKKKWNKK